MANISIDQLANEIAKGLSQYSNDVVEKVNISSARVGKAAVKRLKAVKFKSGTGEYSKSWRMKTEPTQGQPNRQIIHNKDHYQLTHLLEHGHAKANGGRVSAIPHIGPVEEEVIREFVSKVEEAIRDG